MSVVFDRAVAFYDQTRGLPQQAEQWLAEAAGESVGLGAGSTALEIGVGTGRIAIPLARVNRFRYTGVDLSRSMMDVLRSKARNLPIALVRGDVARLPFAAGTFDAIVAVHVFHLISDWQQAMDEVARVLRPGGALLHGRTEHVLASAVKELRSQMHRSATEGEDRQDDGRLSHDQVRLELEQRFGSPREVATPAWTVTRTPGEILRLYEDRCWSSTWALSEETLARVVAEGKRWAIERFGSLDASVQEEQRFVWDVYSQSGPR